MRSILPGLLLLTLTLVEAASLDQSGFNPDREAYEYGHRSTPNLPVSGMTKRMDSNRCAMLHDGADYRLYCALRGSDARIAQFAFNRSSGAYEAGYRSIPEIPVFGAPASADPARMAMVHDGADFRLYLADRQRPWVLHQFAFNAHTARYEYGYRSLAELRVVGMPADADPQRFAMLHDGEFFRFYAASRGSNGLHQAAFNVQSGRYEYGYRSIARIPVTGMPGGLRGRGFMMLHDGDVFRLYALNR